MFVVTFLKNINFKNNFFDLDLDFFCNKALSFLDIFFLMQLKSIHVLDYKTYLFLNEMMTTWIQLGSLCNILNQIFFLKFWEGTKRSRHRKIFFLILWSVKASNRWLLLPRDNELKSWCVNSKRESVWFELIFFEITIHRFYARFFTSFCSFSSNLF